jgi:UDP-galactose transporter B1
LAASVICDALFSDSQAYAKGNFKPTANQLFTTSNFYGFLIIFLFSVFVDQSILPAIQFFKNYPSVLGDLFLASILQVIGQISIYYVVANFKQHMFPMISTTRKMITVIASIFYFGHYINKWQWVSIGIVFLGMFYELYE